MTDDRLERMQSMAERCSHNGSVDPITLRQNKALLIDLEPEDHLRLKVAAGRQSIRAGLGIPNEKVEAFFAAKRERTLR